MPKYNGVGGSSPNFGGLASLPLTGQWLNFQDADYNVSVSSGVLVTNWKFRVGNISLNPSSSNPTLNSTAYNNLKSVRCSSGQFLSVLNASVYGVLSGAKTPLVIPLQLRTPAVIPTGVLTGINILSSGGGPMMILEPFYAGPVTLQFYRFSTSAHQCVLNKTVAANTDYTVVLYADGTNWCLLDENGTATTPDISQAITGIDFFGINTQEGVVGFGDGYTRRCGVATTTALKASSDAAKIYNWMLANP